MSAARARGIMCYRANIILSLRSRSEENLAPLTTHEDTECLPNGEKRAGNMISHRGDQQTYLLKLGEREVMGHQWLCVKPAERERSYFETSKVSGNQ